MLPSLGFQELLLLGVLALVVIGPKDLPLMLRKLGRMTAKLRAMANEFRSGFDELARQAELDELKKEVQALRQNTAFTDIQREIKEATTLPPIAPAPPPALDSAQTSTASPMTAPAPIHDTPVHALLEPTPADPETERLETERLETERKAGAGGGA